MVNFKTLVEGAVSIPGQDESLLRLIERGNLLPIISGEALEDMIVGSHTDLVDRYAQVIDYPLQDRSELHRMAKFRSLDKKCKDQELKTEYLEVVAKHLIEVANKDMDIPEEAINDAATAAASVSDFVERLNLPTLGKERSNPLMILANLPLPVFITTTPYTFIEQLLRNAGKEPETEFCRWHSGLDSIASTLSSGTGNSHFQPTKQKPLVYHLYGLDKYEDSLMLTEDDYLDFLMAVSQGRGKDQDPIHSEVKGALQSKALLLMGFSLSSWSFRVMYRGLIKPMPVASLYQRYCCLQLVPNSDEKRYFESYLRQEAHFDKVYWKSLDAFCREDLASGASRTSVPAG